MRLRISVLLLIVLIFSSCSSDTNIRSEKFNLNLAREKWENANITNYSIKEQKNCFCGGLLEWEVYVENNVKVKVSYDESKLPPGQTYDDIFENARTIEDAFDFIESLFKKDLASLSITYDNIYGYPHHISIDYVEGAVDDEIGYVYSELEIHN